MTADKYPQTIVRVPERCLACGAHWAGGHEIPGGRMRLFMRVFYKCGASLSVAEDLGDGCYMLRFKNCGAEESNDG